MSPTSLSDLPFSVLPNSSAGGSARVLRFDELFAGLSSIVIGRERDCSIPLPHPTVSLYHAMLERSGENLLVQDLESATGVFVNGRRVRQAIQIREGDRFGIGPFLFTRRGASLLMLDSSRSLRLEGRGLTRAIPLPHGGERKLIDDINLVVRPGEFVSLLGPSGSGKSTLMDCLNGRRRATQGVVLANGQNFYEQFDSFRQSLGYVPQRDIVHTQLSVRRALYYTARLRLPTDTEPAELESRIEDIIHQMELTPHRDTLVGNLSGGQMKRVSLGAELLARPSLLYIDEATSGLDAGTEARMMRLFRQLAEEGKSIICITHAIENVDQCHLVLVLNGGRLMYYGPPEEAPGYFGVKSLSQVYDRLTSRDPVECHAEFLASRYHKEFVEDRLAESDAFSLAGGHTPPVEVGEPGDAEDVVSPQDSSTDVKIDASTAALTTETPSSDENASGGADRHNLRGIRRGYRKARRVARPIKLAWHQFHVLTTRYLEMILRDPRSLRLLLLQAPIVAIFLLVGFAHKPYQDEMPVARPLAANEREMLTQINAWNLVMADDKTLTDEQRSRLAKLNFTMTVGGRDQPINGKTMHEELQALHDPKSFAVTAKKIEQWSIRLEEVTPRATVSGKDLLNAFNKAGKSKLADLLLSSKKPVILMDKRLDPRFTYVLLNIVAITIFWFGCNSAAKEIVKEEAIYSRERAVNLGIMPYLASKFIVLGLMATLQTFMLSGIVYGALWWLHLNYAHDYPPDVYMLNFMPQFAVLAMLSIVGVAVGLVLSACVSNPDRANALLPYVLIPQIILGGAIIPVKGEPINTLATLFSPVCWAFRAIHRGSNLLPEYHPLFQSADYSIAEVGLALGVQLVVMLIATALFLRAKDIGK